MRICVPTPYPTIDFDDRTTLSRSLFASPWHPEREFSRAERYDRSSAFSPTIVFLNDGEGSIIEELGNVNPVSYTHLTLPTILLV